MTSRVVVDGYRDLQRALRKFEPQVRKDFNKEMRQIANKVATDARGRAGWSSRIPQAIGVSVTMKAVSIKVSRRKAPHGRIYEQGGRHPVFGNRNVWVQTPARPYLQPALDANRTRVISEVDEAIRRVGKKVGL